MTLGLIFLIILISVVALSEIREKNKRIEKLQKDWRFCKSLLDDAREMLTQEQREQLN